jgi:DNA-binding NarL/FixJ family response regulator
MGGLRYVIADDHKIFRQGLRIALGSDPGLSFIGEAENGQKLLELLKVKTPDLILLDVHMPRMDGIDATREINKLYPDMKIIILTIREDEQLVYHLLELGAHAYLLKNAEPADIKKAMFAVCANGYYINQMVSKTMIKELLKKKSLSTNLRDNVTLTERETLILELICKEYTSAEIGERLYLSPRTVEGIRAEIQHKIGVKSAVGLAIYAMKNGIVK